MMSAAPGGGGERPWRCLRSAREPGVVNLVQLGGELVAPLHQSRQPARGAQFKLVAQFFVGENRIAHHIDMLDGGNRTFINVDIDGQQAGARRKRIVHRSCPALQCIQLRAGQNASTYTVQDRGVSLVFFLPELRFQIANSEYILSPNCRICDEASTTAFTPVDRRQLKKIAA